MTRPWILIGCPVYDREWILPAYFEAIENQNFSQEDLGFIFLVSPDDKPTIAELVRFSSRHPEHKVFSIVEDSESEHRSHTEPANDGSGQWRSWGQYPNRYQTMVAMRNNILNHVVTLNPDFYFSLDSDIVLTDPNTISGLIESMSFADAASPLMYMYPEGTAFPNVMSWIGDVGGPGYRPPFPIGSAFKADVIMAGVMMSRPVYQTARYQWHRQGEDLGWASDSTLKGFTMYCVSNIYAVHVMSRFHWRHYLEHGDPRSPYDDSEFRSKRQEMQSMRAG